MTPRESAIKRLQEDTCHLPAGKPFTVDSTARKTVTGLPALRPVLLGKPGIKKQRCCR